MKLLLVHAFATLALVGLIWTIQLVHYPLMAEIRQGFGNYHRLHSERITWIVAPLMATELITGLMLLSTLPAGVPRAWAWIGAALIGVAWLATAFVSIPRHNALSGGYDADTIASLVRTNWPRTIAWTARGILALAMVNAHANA